MIFWMARTARGMRAELHGRMDHAAAAGRGAVMVLALLAVGREGLETALFLWAGARASDASVAPLAGAVLGLATAVVIGWLLFRGALRVNLRAFFAWTGVFLIVVSGGVLGHGIHELQEAGILPGAANLAFDVSAAIPSSGLPGTILKGIFSFSPATTWLELIAWFAYVVPVTIAFVRIVRGHAPTAPAAGAAHPSTSTPA
jgi:high-affinity iron transporter